MIDKYEYVHLRNLGELTKYKEDSANEQEVEIIYLLKEYYNNSKSNFNPKWIYNNFSPDLYKHKYKNMSVDIVSNIKLEQVEDFIGVEFTKPESDDGKFIVKAMETYKGYTQYVEYKIVSNCSNKFIINEINNDIGIFKFSNY